MLRAGDHHNLSHRLLGILYRIVMALLGLLATAAVRAESSGPLIGYTEFRMDRSGAESGNSTSCDSATGPSDALRISHGVTGPCGPTGNRCPGSDPAVVTVPRIHGRYTHQAPTASCEVDVEVT